ncbi:hypothetical protein Poly21_39440 [Allorhodopirellula heiligendammensis]|uniref:Uncharacterized protein n=1 Tax=Allorhodopirellula heiligendammensis TaxID=2714739 RepID=A0A5C6BXW3_9BACT|nr:hypothetical protein Poly21_39440 [Allorhodopirellula heiligendammensis]
MASVSMPISQVPARGKFNADALIEQDGAPDLLSSLHVQDAAGEIDFRA